LGLLTSVSSVSRSISQEKYAAINEESILKKAQLWHIKMSNV
jgi:hypothetical protein